jgi:hypothetical protein
VELYRFCLENCLSGEGGALIEARRCEFVLVGDAGRQKIEDLRSACASVGGHVRGVKRFAFEGPAQADRFAENARGSGVKVHTLRNHVESLASYLRKREEHLAQALSGAKKYEPRAPTMLLDPLTRKWRGTSAGEVEKSCYAVLRDNEGFYIAYFGGAVKVLAEEAYLFALKYVYQEKNIVVMVDGGGNYIAIRSNDLGNLPDSVFYTFLRLQPALRRGATLMVFYRADTDMVFRALGLAKLAPVIATGIARLTHKLGVKEVEVVSPHLASKEASLLSEVFSALGYAVRYGDQCIEVELDGGPVRIYLASSGKYLSGLLSDGAKAIFVPLRYLITADRALSAFKMVRTYGFSIITAEQWARVLEKLCELAEGKPAGATKLAEEALLASRSKPEILTALASNPTVRAAASRLIELAAQGRSGTPLDGLPLEELFAIWRRISETPLP